MAHDDEGLGPGPIEVTIGGKTYPAICDWRALRQIEARVAPLSQLCRASVGGEFGVSDTAAVVREAIVSGAGGSPRGLPSLDDVANEIMRTGLAAWVGIRAELLMPAFAGSSKADDDEEADSGE